MKDTERIERTKSLMAVRDIDVLICRLPENIKMLSGHWPLVGMSFLVFPLEGESRLIVPHCDENEAKEETWTDSLASYRFAVLDAGDPYADIATELKAGVNSSQRRIGIEGSFETVAPPWNAAEPAIPAGVTRSMLESVFGAGSLVDATDILNELRARKTPNEQDMFRVVNQISTFGLSAFRSAVEIGRSGIELVAAVEQAILLEGTGYEGVRRVRAFAQVSTGSDETAIGYRPMEISTRRTLQNDDIALLELAVVADGFWCDRTRAVVAGRAGEKHMEMHATILEAQQAAIHAIKPGVSCGAVDLAARSIVYREGYSQKEFLHVTGHGLGFKYHEPTPLILPGSEELLEEGMLHSVEPGVYMQEHGGLRIEDNVLVTNQGAEVLGVFDKSL